MSYVLGIDIGGSKTAALLADSAGEVVASARGPGIHFHSHSSSEVEEILARLLAKLKGPNGLGLRAVTAVCLGVAGVDRPSEREALRGILQRLGLSPTVRLVTDAEIALIAGAPRRTGIVLVAGTGSIAYGAAPDGRKERAGGWGYLLADEGSAFWLGHEALRRSVRAVDGRGEETALSGLVARALGLELPAGLISWAYEEGTPRYRFAGLATLVTAAAESGDRVALEILDEAAGHLASAARAVDRKLGFEAPYPLIFSGGVLRGSGLLVERIEAALDLPLARPALLAHEPALGAVRLALDQAKKR